MTEVYVNVKNEWKKFTATEDELDTLKSWSKGIPPEEFSSLWQILIELPTTPLDFPLRDERVFFIDNILLE